MKQCNLCGYVDMTDTCQLCPQCGTPFPNAKPGKGNKNRQRSSSGSVMPLKQNVPGTASWKPKCRPLSVKPRPPSSRIGSS